MSLDLDYCCAECGRTIVKAEETITTVITAKCPRCKQITELEPRERQPLHRTYQCTNEECGRKLRVERPTRERTHCVVCGTDSLEVIRETPSRTPSEEGTRGRSGVEVLTARERN